MKHSNYSRNLQLVKLDHSEWTHWCWRPYNYSLVKRITQHINRTHVFHAADVFLSSYPNSPTAVIFLRLARLSSLKHLLSLHNGLISAPIANRLHWSELQPTWQKKPPKKLESFPAWARWRSVTSGLWKGYLAWPADDCGRGSESQDLETQWDTNHTGDLPHAHAPKRQRDHICVVHGVYSRSTLDLKISWK